MSDKANIKKNQSKLALGLSFAPAKASDVAELGNKT